MIMNVSSTRWGDRFYFVVFAGWRRADCMFLDMVNVMNAKIITE